MIDVPHIGDRDITACSKLYIDTLRPYKRPRQVFSHHLTAQHECQELEAQLEARVGVP